MVYANIVDNPVDVVAVQSILLWGSTGTLPFAVLSIWYQGRVIRQWCPLCLFILLLVWVEVITGWVAGLAYALPSWLGIQIVFVTFLVPILALVFVKPYLSEAVESGLIRSDLLHFRRNTSIFYHLLYQQPALKSTLPLDSLVFVGNKDANFTLTIVTNPFCTPCTQLHHRLITLLAENELVNAHLIISVTSQLNDPRRKLAYQLLSIPPEQRLSQLNQWLKEPSQTLLKRFKSMTGNVANDQVSTWLTRHQKWCKENAIAATPSIYLNGYKVPNGYQLDDIIELLQYSYTDRNQEVVG